VARTLGVGLIGAGRIFQDHVRALECLRDRATLVAVADAEPSQLRSATDRHFLPVASRDARELLARSDLDVVIVSTPPACHESIVVAALEAGKRVVCEKPLAHTLEAADRILEVADARPGRLSVVYQLRYLPEIQRLLWLRDHDRLGRLLFGHVHRTERAPGRAGASAWWGRWATAGGGAAMTQFIHQLDLLLFVFGPAQEVSAAMTTHSEGLESEDTFAASVRFRSGAIAGCSCCTAARHSEFRFDVVAERASVHLPWRLDGADPEAQRDALAAHPDSERPASRSLPARALRKSLRVLGLRDAPGPAPNRHVPYLAEVLDAARRDDPLPVGPHQARASLELCVALYTSALRGEPVSLPLPRSGGFYAGVHPEDYAGLCGAA